MFSHFLNIAFHTQVGDNIHKDSETIIKKQLSEKHSPVSNILKVFLNLEYMQK